MRPRLSTGTRLGLLHSINQNKPQDQPRFKVLVRRLFFQWEELHSHIAMGVGQGKDLTTHRTTVKTFTFAVLSKTVVALIMWQGHSRSV